MNLAYHSGSARSPGVGNGYPLQYSCLENPMDRGAKELDTTEQLNLIMLLYLLEVVHSFLFFIYVFWHVYIAVHICIIYLFLAALSLHCYTWAFSSSSKWGLLSCFSARACKCSGFSFVQSTVSRHMGFSRWSLWALECGLSSYSTQALLLGSMWNLPRPEI